MPDEQSCCRDIRAITGGGVVGGLSALFLKLLLDFPPQEGADAWGWTVGAGAGLGALLVMLVKYCLPSYASFPVSRSMWGGDNQLLESRGAGVSSSRGSEPANPALVAASNENAGPPAGSAYAQF